MSEEQEPRKVLKQNTSAIVAVSIVAVAFGEGLADGLLSAAQHSNLQAGTSDYIEFANLYLSTFLLSATLTAAVAATVIPPLYNTQVSYWVPIIILVSGASATGLPVTPEGGTPAGWVFGALSTFVQYYGLAAFGGFIVGCAGGFILYEVADYVRKNTS